MDRFLPSLLSMLCSGDPLKGRSSTETAHHKKKRAGKERRRDRLEEQK